MKDFPLHTDKQATLDNTQNITRVSPRAPSALHSSSCVEDQFERFRVEGVLRAKNSNIIVIDRVPFYCSHAQEVLGGQSTLSRCLHIRIK